MALRVGTLSGLSGTDLASFLACGHISTLDRQSAAGVLRRPHFRDPAAELLAARGEQHERAHLDLLRRQRSPVVEIDGPWDATVEQTRAAMRQGASVIYQASFSVPPWRGRPDFLLRVETPSGLGAWAYEIADTKLARSPKPKALIQLCLYAELLATEQGIPPDVVHLVLGGDAGSVAFRLPDFAAYYRRVKASFLASIASDGVATYPEPVDQCRICDWYSVCDQQWHDDDALCLVPGVTRTQRKALSGRSISTVAGLGALDLPLRPPLERVGSAALERIRDQARVQVRGRVAGRLLHELVAEVEPNRGLAALPEPSTGDLFLDIEGDPYVADIGLEYLFGIVLEADGTPTYRQWWALDRSAERAAFEAVVDFIADARRAVPAMHVFHYNHYEPTALKKLAGRFNTRVDVVDDLLRGGVFVDLYRVVRQSVRASVESYSIKRLEPLYGFTRETDLRDATRCLQAIETWLHLSGGAGDHEPAMRSQIESYNRDDCLSAFHLRAWLEAERARLAGELGRAIPRPEAPNVELSEEFTERHAEVQRVMDRLLSGVPDDSSHRTPDQAARWLMANLLEWHRREEKSTWWEYFRLCELTDEELQEDKSALGGLEYVGEAGRIKKSKVYRYRFPRQEHGFDVGDTPHDPTTQSSTGTIVAIDESACTIDIKRGPRSSAPHPSGLIPLDIVSTAAMKDSLLALGAAMDPASGERVSRLAWDLLLGAPPRIRGRDVGAVLAGTNERIVDAAVRTGLALESSALAVQGPPGSGKTFTGARMIVELVRAGKKVGITGNSHKVISNLLTKVCGAAREAGVRLRAVQKVSDVEVEGVEDPAVVVTEHNEEVLAALRGGQAQVAAGTAWMWARPEFRGSVAVLFADEAGQLSLANVLAISPATHSLVLLGDPQQLDQPQKGVHPPGADASALGHLLGGRRTIPPDRGLFLAETWRLHPQICDFVSKTFYDGRLLPHPANSVQRVVADGLRTGTGLRFLPVPHTGNQSESAEEVDAVAWLIQETLRGGPRWIDRDGKDTRLTLDDILVVAPYNAQVAALSVRLPSGARVGTVDKFQGQEAPIVVYSMATSTPEDAPRGMEFLYRPNRLNVAISRARCVAVLVASPALFDVACRTPHQMRLANAFCRLLELASVVEQPVARAKRDPAKAVS